jgi:hypothetical protein
MDTRNPKFKFEKGKIRGPQALIDKWCIYFFNKW